MTWMACARMNEVLMTIIHEQRTTKSRFPQMRVETSHIGQRECVEGGRGVLVESGVASWRLDVLSDSVRIPQRIASPWKCFLPSNG